VAGAEDVEAGLGCWCDCVCCWIPDLRIVTFAEAVPKQNLPVRKHYVGICPEAYAQSGPSTVGQWSSVQTWPYRAVSKRGYDKQEQTVGETSPCQQVAGTLAPGGDRHVCPQSQPGNRCESGLTVAAKSFLAQNWDVRLKAAPYGVGGSNCS